MDDLVSETLPPEALDQEESLADALENLLATRDASDLGSLCVEMQALYASIQRDHVTVTVAQGPALAAGKPILTVEDPRPEAQGGEGGLWTWIAYGEHQPLDADDNPVGEPLVGWYVIEPALGLDLRILVFVAHGPPILRSRRRNGLRGTPRDGRSGLRDRGRLREP